MGKTVEGGAAGEGVGRDVAGCDEKRLDAIGYKGRGGKGWEGLWSVGLMKTIEVRVLGCMQCRAGGEGD